MKTHEGDEGGRVKFSGAASCEHEHSSEHTATVSRCDTCGAFLRVWWEWIGPSETTAPPGPEKEAKGAKEGA
jgi:hypothetical protein